MHQAPPEDELTGLRGSVSSGLPFDSSDWVERLGEELELDLTIRPLYRPRKAPAKPIGPERLGPNGKALKSF